MDARSSPLSISLLMTAPILREPLRTKTYQELEIYMLEIWSSSSWMMFNDSGDRQAS